MTRRRGNRGAVPHVDLNRGRLDSGLLRDGRPIRPLRVAATAMKVLKHQPASSGEHFRVMQNVDDFGRITVVFDDFTIAEVIGHDLSISGIRNELSVIADFGQYDLRVNPNNENELFLPDGRAAGGRRRRDRVGRKIGNRRVETEKFSPGEIRDRERDGTPHQL